MARPIQSDLLRSSAHSPSWFALNRSTPGGRADMSLALAGISGLEVFASQGNFVLVKLPQGADGTRLRDYMLAEHGVFVRECGNKLGSSSSFVRLVVRPAADVGRLLTGLQAFLYGTGVAAPAPCVPVRAALPSLPPPVRAS